MYKHGLGTTQARRIHPVPPWALSLSPTPTPAAASTAIDKFTTELYQSNCSSHHAPSFLLSWYHHETLSRPGYSTPYQSHARTAVLELHRKPPWLQATCADLIILFSAASPPAKPPLETRRVLSAFCTRHQPSAIGARIPADSSEVAAVGSPFRSMRYELARVPPSSRWI
jgi:hypothetical protein